MKQKLADLYNKNGGTRQAYAIYMEIYRTIPRENYPFEICFLQTIAETGEKVQDFQKALEIYKGMLRCAKENAPAKWTENWPGILEPRIERCENRVKTMK